MKTDVDTALNDIADWYVKNRRSMTEPELEAILNKHCESEAEVLKFAKFLETEAGQMRFKTLLRERKEEKPSYLKEETSSGQKSSNPGAKRICPLCGATLESYSGMPLKAVAKRHYFIVHSGNITEEQNKIWKSFYDSLPVR
jgi:hypothetical protein